MMAVSKVGLALVAFLLLTAASLNYRIGWAYGLETRLPSGCEGIIAERNGKVEKTARLVIEALLKDKKRTNAFEQYFRFSQLSPEEKSTLEKLGYDPSDESTRYKDAKIGSRALTVSWNYAYQPVLLALGTADLKGGQGFKATFEEAQTIIEEQRNRILAKRGLSEEQFYSLLDLKAAKDGDTLERNLTILENIDADLEQFIEQKTNQAILNGNIAKIEESLLIEEHTVGGRRLYEIHFKPMFKMVLSQQGSELKMLAFGDVA